MKYAFMKDNKHTYSIQAMSRAFGVSPSGFHAWLKRPQSKRDNDNQKLDQKIKVIFDTHKERYGSPRITSELKDQGETCGENRVANRMKTLELKAVAARKYKVTTDSEHSRPVAPNLLEQNFAAEKQNQKWVSDITYLWTDEGWLYLATVMDLFSRSIVGWSMHKRMTKKLICDALLMALWRRGFPKNVIVHSDRGSQYCSGTYQQLLKDNSLRCSMSGRGNCYDNAAMESFFHTLKVEEVHRVRYCTRDQARYRIFEYIESYYNTIRRHSANGNKSPLQHEIMAKAL